MKETTFSKNQKRAIFIIDSTWACSTKMIRESKNLHSLKHVSFSSSKLSEFKIKEQPAEYCLSTIESTLCVIENLNKHNIENIQKDLPFKASIHFSTLKKCSIKMAITMPPIIKEVGPILHVKKLLWDNMKNLMQT